MTTIPKTHPLYGATELVAKAIYCDGAYEQYSDGTPARLGANDSRWEMTSEVQRQFCRAQARAAIRALESAGYRVVGPEPTEAMLEDSEEMYMPMGEMIDAWAGFWHAAPTITETEKGAA